MTTEQSATSERPDAIRQSIEIDAPVDTIWRLVSEPGWWINDGELEPHEIRRSEQPDGTTIADVRGHSAGVWRLIVVELREREYAAFRWAPHAAADRDATSPIGSTLVEFTLHEASAPGRVVVEVVESGFRTIVASPDKIAENYDENTEGWGAELAVLRTAAASA